RGRGLRPRMGRLQRFGREISPSLPAAPNFLHYLLREPLGLTPRAPNGALQATHQPPAVGIVQDDALPAVTPCHDMIDGIGILDPQSFCHHPIESSCRVSFNKKF